MTEDWRARASCRGKTEEWVVERGQRPDAMPALQACELCPVIDPCRSYAARFAWAGIIVGGWAAPSKGPPAKPPWA